MPTWGMHLLTAKKLLNKIPKKLKVSNNEFKLGNLLPDIPNGFVIKNISLNIAHSTTHFEKEIIVEGHKEKRTDIKGFFDKYHNKFNNPLIIGYYTHLLTDAYWNNKTYGEKAILDNPNHHIGMLTSDKYTYEPIVRKEMTISEIEKELGYPIKIIKED